MFSKFLRPLPGHVPSQCPLYTRFLTCTKGPCAPRALEHLRGRPPSPQGPASPRLGEQEAGSSWGPLADGPWLLPLVWVVGGLVGSP